MINRSAIQEWGAQVPWTDNAQVEQDLLISRCLVAIFNDNFLRNQLAFRGGTAISYGIRNTSRHADSFETGDKLL